MNIKKVMVALGCCFVLVGCLGQGTGSATSGVMKSEDGGRTFVASNFIDDKHTLGRSNIHALAIDPHDNSSVYVGTDTDDVFVSKDAAKTWTSLSTGLTSISDIVISAKNPQEIYVGGMYSGRGSVVRTQDGGKNWERVYVEPQDGTSVTAVVASVDGGIYIGTSGGTIARSNDSGKTWENIYKASNIIEDIGVGTPQDPRTVYALVNGEGVVLSRDGGTSFEVVSYMERDVYTQKMYEGIVYSMTVDRQKSGMVIVGTDQGLFKTQDYGLSWDPIDVIASTIGLPVYALAISPHNAQLVYAVAKAVYTSVANRWVITDTTSAYTVDVIAHDPKNANVVYIGLKRTK